MFTSQTKEDLEKCSLIAHHKSNQFRHISATTAWAMEESASQLADSAENQPAINGTEHGLDVEMKDELVPEVNHFLSTSIQVQLG